jgi:cellulose biosynthesis protein BcsQ
MKESFLLAVTGDKGGVGKSTIAALLAEWLLYNKYAIHIVDADPNQSTQTWIDKCREVGRVISTRDANITIVDTAGTSGSSLTKYIRQADMILVPFKPHVADLEVIVGWFLSLKEELQKRVFFIPNMLSPTKEQRAGVEELKSVVSGEGRGSVLPGLTERKAVYPPLLNGSKDNFFDSRLDKNTRAETSNLFTEVMRNLEE